MSDEKVKELDSISPAKPNPSSIMSAPRQSRSAERLFILIGALVLSIAVNVVLAVTFISKNNQITQLKSEVENDKSLILELKEKINSQASF